VQDVAPQALGAMEVAVVACGKEVPMSRAPALRLAVAAVLLLVLAPSTVAASPGPSAPHGLLDPIWQWLHAIGVAGGDAIERAGLKVLAANDEVTRRASWGSASHRAVAAADGAYIDPFGIKAVSLGHAPRATARGGALQRGPWQH